MISPHGRKADYELTSHRPQTQDKLGKRQSGREGLYTKGQQIAQSMDLRACRSSGNLSSFTTTGQIS